MTVAARREQALESVRGAFSELLGAERRLRGRDQQRPGELTHAQLRALAALDRHHELSSGALARAADLNPASVTAMVDHLERDGIVERSRSAEDRRVCNVSLTREGGALLAGKRERWNALWAERLAGIPEADLDAAVRVMQAVAQMLDEI